jgi:hypothetical protein
LLLAGGRLISFFLVLVKVIGFEEVHPQKWQEYYLEGVVDVLDVHDIAEECLSEDVFEDAHRGYCDSVLRRKKFLGLIRAHLYDDIARLLLPPGEVGSDQVNPELFQITGLHRLDLLVPVLHPERAIDDVHHIAVGDVTCVLHVEVEYMRLALLDLHVLVGELDRGKAHTVLRVPAVLADARDTGRIVASRGGTVEGARETFGRLAEPVTAPKDAAVERRVAGLVGIIAAAVLAARTRGLKRFLALPVTALDLVAATLIGPFVVRIAVPIETWAVRRDGVTVLTELDVTHPVVLACVL